MAKRDTEAARLERGRQGWATIKKSTDIWEAWAPICDALAILSSKAMRLAHTNKPTGGKYAAIFGRMLAQHELSDIPTTTRAAAIKCGRHSKVIDQHRAQMQRDDFAVFLKLSHPQAVWAAIRPLVMTDVERREAQRKKDERKLAKEVAAGEADGEKINISRLDADDIAEELLTKLPDQETVRGTIKRLLALAAPKAVILLGDERPEELARILNDEVKLTKLDAEALCTDLMAFYHTDSGQDAVVWPPVPNSRKAQKDTAIIAKLRERLDAVVACDSTEESEAFKEDGNDQTTEIE